MWFAKVERKEKKLIIGLSHRFLDLISLKPCVPVVTRQSLLLGTIVFVFVDLHSRSQGCLDELVHSFPCKVFKQST